MGEARPFDRSDSVPLVRPIAAQSPDATGSKLLGLELLRFAAALAVLFFHYSHFTKMAGMPAMARNEAPFYALLWPLYDYGQFGVQLFWGISGYIFFWKYGEAIHSRAVSAGKFFWLRFSRLYPLHLVTLLAVVALQSWHRHVTGFDFVYPAQDTGLLVRQLLIATDWGPPAPFSYNGPIWSISAEVAVYTGFFLVLSRFAPGIRLCLAVITAGLMLQLAGFGWVSIGCATFFFAGGLAALAPPTMRLKAGMALVGLIGLALATGLLNDRGKLPMFLLAAVPCLLVLVGGEQPLLNRWQQLIESAGNLTYSTYLLHFPLQLGLAIAVARSGTAPSLTDPLFLIVYLGVTLAIAGASFRWLEMPAQNWLRQRKPHRLTD
jgi:peptidoglycan/LPS O-acetylase OafA/YrhL